MTRTRPCIFLAFVLAFCFVQQAKGFQTDFVWSEDQASFAYQKQDSPDGEYWICDTQSRTVSPAFDVEKVKASLQRDFGIDRPSLSIAGFQQRLPVVQVSGGRLFSVAPENVLTELKGEEFQGLPVQRLFKRKQSSRRQSRTSNLEVVNNTAHEFTIDWVTERGGTRSYGVVEAGKSFSISTYENHVWQLKNEAKGTVYFVVRGSSDRILLDEPSLAEASEAGPFAEKQSSREQPRAAFENNTRRRGANASVFVRSHNLFLKANGDEYQLTDDATQENSFQRFGGGTRWFNLDERQANRGHVFWSPSGKHFIAMQTTQPPEPRVYYIESSPRSEDQGFEATQPSLKSYSYPKPGDLLPINRPRLFSVETKAEIVVSNELFDNPFSLRVLGWSDSEDRVWLQYNQRGHQVFRILEMDVASGDVRSLIEETSDTFIQYSGRGKLLLGRLGEGEILWASQRSGWSHLYVYSKDTGEVVRQLTQGNWNFKRIHAIDYENQVVWFYAVGVHPDQDPYHEHFCRVSFDGSGFQALTSSDGTHEVDFLSNEQFLEAKWSRVDQAEVKEIRDAKSGKLVAELDRRNTRNVFGERPLTTRFHAKGRDGETDIWGIIHWPKDFDPKQKYPVVENIYAGPHDHHVPKRFRSRYYQQHAIADSGKIVVQIDGMGTAWRSKAFHDVCFQNLRDAGFPDRIAWMKAAAEKYPQMDIRRVGIYGGSAGGQNAKAALLWHNDFYSVAVADCGCHDNRMDKIWWNEQWMGWPVDKHYEDSSNMENAHLLEGNLMLTLGELDQNVDPASTTQVVDALIKANKDFEFVLVAGQGHGAGESAWASRKRRQFLTEHLGLPVPLAPGD